MLPFILASESPSRLNLLSRIKITPDRIIPAHIDETPLKGELPAPLSKRLAQAKADVVASEISEGILLTADTVSCAGRTIMPKAESDDLVRYCLSKLSGRRSRLYTTVCVVKKTPSELVKRVRTVCTILKIKRLTKEEIEYYIESGEGLNKAGGFAIEGIAGSFIEFINGSYSNIVGLPLFETRNMLLSVGFKF